MNEFFFLILMASFLESMCFQDTFLSNFTYGDIAHYAYDEKFYHIFNNFQQKIAVAAVAYNRPYYLQRVLVSLEKNPESQEVPLYFFLDGDSSSRQSENI